MGDSGVSSPLSAQFFSGRQAELAEQLGNMVEYPNLSQPNQGLKPDGTPCID